jgi:hypothetical protein
MYRGADYGAVSRERSKALLNIFFSSLEFPLASNITMFNEVAAMLLQICVWKLICKSFCHEKYEQENFRAGKGVIFSIVVSRLFLFELTRVSKYFIFTFVFIVVSGVVKVRSVVFRLELTDAASWQYTFSNFFCVQSSNHDMSERARDAQVESGGLTRNVS